MDDASESSRSARRSPIETARQVTASSTASMAGATGPGTCAALFLTSKEEVPIVVVPIGDLRGSESPRRSGESKKHIRALADCASALPPIVVNRTTMRVIDGMHRLGAAQLRGQLTIEVQIFDGDAADAFVVAVQSNATHGLPLTLADRTAAAHRIVSSHPDWSDRMIAVATALSPKTVGAIRRRSTDTIPQLTSRVGLDGRTRSVPPVPRPECADRPTHRHRLQRTPPGGSRQGLPQDDNATNGDAVAITGPNRPSERRSRRVSDPWAGSTTVVSVLRKAPSLRFTESGRTILRLLENHDAAMQSPEHLATSVPSHCAHRIAELARYYARAWDVFADRLAAQTPDG